MKSTTVQEPPSRPPAVEDCYFYHSMDVPGLGAMPGQWNLGPGVDAYLGHVGLSGASVLEMGPASGYLTFYMEKRGAAVTACELASFDQWDIVPYDGADLQPYIEDRMSLGRALRNAFWLAHDAHRSNVRLSLSSVYDTPEELGSFDVTTFGSVLLHVRDPLLALTNAAKRTTDTIIVTDMVPGAELSPQALELLRPRPATGPLRPTASEDLTDIVGAELAAMPPKMHFVPRFENQAPMDTWWQINPGLIQQALGILGFRSQEVTYHYQVYNPKYRWANPAADDEPVYLPLFTVVGRR